MVKDNKGNGTRKPPVKRSMEHRMARREFAKAADFLVLAARAARDDRPGDAIEHATKALNVIRDGVKLAEPAQQTIGNASEPRPAP